MCMHKINEVVLEYEVPKTGISTNVK